MAFPAFEMFVMGIRSNLVILSPIPEAELPKQSHFGKKLNRAKNARPAGIWKHGEEIFDPKETEARHALEYGLPFRRHAFAMRFEQAFDIHIHN
jgi:hypothetical protein